MCGYNANQQNYAGYSTAQPAPDQAGAEMSSYGSQEVLERVEENQQTEKHPFAIIIREIIRGLAGDQYAANANPAVFRTKLNQSETQNMSGLLFFNSFTQRDVNLQCAMLSQVIQYWSLEDTIPDLSSQDDDCHEGNPRSRSPRSPRSPREGRSQHSKKKRKIPPPRYWSRLENATVVGLMLGLPLDLLKVVLERRADLSLGPVDAILNTNTLEVTSLMQAIINTR